MITLCILLYAAFQMFVLAFTVAAYVVGGIIAVIASGLGVYDPNKQTEVKPPKHKKRKRGFSDEEILALGLHPDDEGYKMSLISSILDK